MRFRDKFCVCILILFIMFFSFGKIYSNAMPINEFVKDDIGYVDYTFTVKEVSLSTITDDSIRITSENLDRDFLKNAKFLRSLGLYDVSYENDDLIVSGLIPDFLYNKLYVEAESHDGEKYILKIKDFKTAKSQNVIKQFVSQTIQYTLKKSITPLEFYLWEHKLLTKEVTPEEFIVRILNHPSIFYSEDKREVINRIYSSIFFENISEYKLENLVERFENYKKEYFVKDDEAYNLIIEEMLRSEEFKTKIDLLNIKNLEIPKSTRYLEVYKDYRLKSEKNLNNRIYIMDYDELNRSESYKNGVKLFFNNDIEKFLKMKNEIYIDIPNANVKIFRDGVLIENLDENTVYKNFKIIFKDRSGESILFIQRIKTLGNEMENFFTRRIVDDKVNILNEMNMSVIDFLNYIYKHKYNSYENGSDEDYLKIFLLMNRVKYGKLIKLLNLSDFNIDKEILVKQIYNFVFGRIPDEYGLKFWVEKFEIYKGFMKNVNEISRKIVFEMTYSDEFKYMFNEFILKEVNKYNDKLRRLQIL